MNAPIPKRTRRPVASYVADRPCTVVLEAPPAITGPEDIAREFHRIVAAPGDREHFVAFYLDTRHRVIRGKVVSVGSLNASIVHPREVFREAVALGAADLVLAHNHPSNDVTPSDEDIAITHRLRDGGSLLGIQLLDHVIVGRTTSPSLWTSLRERRILKG